jgi:choline dehydrogenase-like flavoprotein
VPVEGQKILSLITKHLANDTVPFDAVVIGSGLTGGWAAKELSEAGLRVLVLDAGPFVRAKDALDLGMWTAEARRRSSDRQAIQSRHPAYWTENPSLFVDDIDNPYTSSPQDPFVWIRGRQVGGKSLTWGGVTLRFSDNEFLAPLRDGIGPCWPLGYRDLAPFYDRVEELLRVEGSAEGLAELPDGRFSGLPRLTEAEREFKAVVESRWKDRHVIAGRGVPLECGMRNGGDRAWPPKTSLNQTLCRALATGRAVIRPDSVVSHLVVDRRTARIGSVACVDRESGEAFEVFGRVVMLCASTIESVRIMQNSECDQHPRGVGNSSGLLGRYLCDHLVVHLAGSFCAQQGRDQPYPKGGAHGIILPKFCNVARTNQRFTRGYGMWGAMGRGSNGTECESSWALHSLLEVLPQEENRIEIDQSRLDRWGIRVPHVVLRYSGNELQMKKDATESMLEMCDAANLKVEFSGCTAPGQYVHELGGARMGNDQATSVLNSFNQCWDARNLFVVDGSCFVTSGWQNPSLTMMAITVRACSFIVEEMRAGRL